MSETCQHFFIEGFFMKQLKALIALALVGTLFMSCLDITDPDTIANDRDLTWKERTLGNSWGGNEAYSGIDLVNDSAFNASIDGITGEAVFASADSANIDIRTLNTFEYSRATTLTSTITTVNGAKFAVATLRDFEKLSKRQLENAGDAAMLDTLDLATAVDPEDVDGLSYFIAKLANNRGYVLARASLDLERVGSSSDNTGSIDLEYVLLSEVEDIEEDTTSLY